MQQSKGFLASMCLSAVVAASAAHAQLEYEYTRVVDPTATGDSVFNTIQAAIDNADTDPTVRWTILIYAGVYEEEVKLNNNKENINLVGVDPDAVVIKAPDGKDGVIIEGLGARNNSIRNLTIEVPTQVTASNRDAIVIQKPSAGADPSGITIENVSILVAAGTSHGIRADVPVSDVTIRGCDIVCTGETTVGIAFDDTASEISVISTSISTAGDDGHAVLFSGQVTDTVADGLAIDTAGDDAYGIYLAGGDSTDPNADIAFSGAAITTTGDDAHAIYLEHETERFSLLDSTLSLTGHLAVPFNVSSSLGENTIEDLFLTRVAIRHTNQVAAGVQGQATTGMTILECDFFMQDSHTIQAGNDTRVANSSVITRDLSGVGGTDNAGVVASGKSGLRIENSVIEGRLAGVQLKADCTVVRIVNSELRGSHYGFFSECGDDIQVVACTISGDSARGNDGGLPHKPYHGVFIEDDDTVCKPGVIRFVGCDIDGRSTRRLNDGIGVYVKAAPDTGDGPVILENCAITAFQEAATGTDTSHCYGVKADEATAVALLGGSVSSLDGDEWEHDQYDLRCPDAQSTLAISISGTTCSKWLGPIGATVAPLPAVQRTIAVPAASASAVYGPATLPLSQIVISTGLTNPDGYRVLSVTLSQSQSSDYTLTVLGTNEAGESIADQIVVDQGDTYAVGKKAFATVTKLAVGSGTGTVSVGTTDVLGLEFPIDSQEAVQQQGKMASAASSYTIGVPGTVDEQYSTVDVSTVTAGDSFEWAVRASK